MLSSHAGSETSPSHATRNVEIQILARPSASPSSSLISCSEENYPVSLFLWSKPEVRFSLLEYVSIRSNRSVRTRVQRVLNCKLSSEQIYSTFNFCCTWHGTSMVPSRAQWYLELSRYVVKVLRLYIEFPWHSTWYFFGTVISQDTEYLRTFQFLWFQTICHTMASQVTITIFHQHATCHWRYHYDNHYNNNRNGNRYRHPK